MSTKYALAGSSVFLSNEMDMPIVDKLPVDMYTVNLSMERGYYLSRMAEFDVPSKIYGDANEMSDRILRTAVDRSGTTGVLLSGVKGSGKSLTMKLTGIKALDQLGWPVIVVNSAFCGSAFNSFISSIDQPVVLIFDEFEKVYDDEKQEQLLTLFDGVFSSKKLFILTANTRHRINEFMNNRPGRIYYNIEYEGLTPQFIREYCTDVLKDASKIDQILFFTSMFKDFNFDMLKALCEELNRYGETVRQALRVLNIKRDRYSPSYDLQVSVNGEVIDMKKRCSYQTVNNFLSHDDFQIMIDLTDPKAKKAEGEQDDYDYDGEGWEYFSLKPLDSTTIRNADMSRLEFRLEKGVTVVATKTEYTVPGYLGMLD